MIMITKGGYGTTFSKGVTGLASGVLEYLVTRRLHRGRYMDTTLDDTITSVYFFLLKYLAVTHDQFHCLKVIQSSLASRSCCGVEEGHRMANILDIIPLGLDNPKSGKDKIN
jgi:hypothetical protein